MTTMIIFHEVEDGERWAKGWQKGSGSRHELVAKGGVTAARAFRDPENPNSTGLIWDRYGKVAGIHGNQRGQASDGGGGLEG
jgi:hypothetical protein